MFKISREAGHSTHTSNPNSPEAEAEGYKLEAILGYVVGPCLGCELVLQALYPVSHVHLLLQPSLLDCFIPRQLHLVPNNLFVGINLI